MFIICQCRTHKVFSVVSFDRFNVGTRLNIAQAYIAQRKQSA
jgi:hypothetical protein